MAPGGRARRLQRIEAGRRIRKAQVGKEYGERDLLWEEGEARVWI